MYLKIKKAKFEKNSYWKNDIKISMIWLYTDEWKFVKRIKIQSDILLDLIINQEIKISDDVLFNNQNNNERN